MRRRGAKSTILILLTRKVRLLHEADHGTQPTQKGRLLRGFLLLLSFDVYRCLSGNLLLRGVIDYRGLLLATIVDVKDELTAILI